MADQNQIVAIGFLTAHDLSVLGQGFKRAYPISDHHEFDNLLKAIDTAAAEHCDGSRD